MEEWNEYCKGIIPKGNYLIRIIFGEETGLTIELYNDDNRIRIEFGVVFSYRVLDEGYVQTDIYNEEEVEKYRSDNFSNIIYTVEGGKYASDVKKIAGGYLEAIGYYHFVIITQNYNIDVITQWNPQIKISAQPR